MRNELRQLCSEAVEVADFSVQYRYLSPFTDSRKNEPIKKLPAFPAATNKVGQDARILEQFGSTSSELVVLRFVFELLGSLPYREFDDTTFDEVWNAFERELAESDRRFAIVTNLQNFASQDDVIEIADGVSIRARSYEELSSLLGWSFEKIDRTIGDDWSRAVAGGYVLLIQSRQPKRPDNLVLATDPVAGERLARVLLAGC